MDMDELLERAESLIREGRFGEAIHLYEELALGGAEAQGLLLHNLTPLYAKTHRLQRALESAQAAAFFTPCMRSWMVLSSIQEKLGLQDAALASVYRALECDPTNTSAHETRLYLLASRLSPLDARRAAEDYQATFPPSNPRRGVPPPPLRLRVGYVSGDFRQHVMDRIILSLLQFHDRTRVEVFCFDNSHVQDAVSTQMRSYPATWRYIYGLTDEAVAAQVAALQIDVLVDLAGLTAGNRMGVFRLRPAPVQVTGIGYLPTTGADCFDWRLADVEEQAQYTEPLWQLPSGTAPLPLGEVPISSLPARRNGYFTFGYMNGLRKLRPECIAEFVRLLQRFPTAKLLLMSPGASDPVTATSLLRRFDPVQDRVMITQSQGGEAFCKLFAETDFTLDPWPYGGCITSWDSLYHGVPILTRKPDRRIAGDAHRLQTQVLGFAPSYEDLGGLEFLDELEATRMNLRHELLSSPAGDPLLWVRSLENAYQSMREQVSLALAA